MTISYVGAGGLVQHTDTAISVPYSAGPSAGQLGILQVVSGHPSDSIPSTPSGWALAGSFSGGGGSFGSGTGPRRISFFTRVMLGSDAAPTTAIPSGSAGSVIGANLVLLSRSAGTGWRWAAAFGEDTTSGTGFSAPAASALTWAPGDFAWIGYGLPASGTTFTAQGLTAAGATFGAVSTNRFTYAITSGNAARTASASVAETAGSVSVAPTATATLSAAGTGVAGVLRIRESNAAITAAAQAVFPPRVLASVTGMLADNIASASIYRTAGGVQAPVRAATGVAVTGMDALLRVDGAQPFGVPVAYAADLTDVNGLVWTVTASSTVTSTVTTDVISDEITGLGASIHIETWPDKQRTRDSTQFNVGGRIVVVSRPRSSATATVTVRTETAIDGDALDGVFDTATEGVILIRKSTTMPGVDGYLAAVTDAENRNWFDEFRWWTLDSVEVEAWPDALEAAGFTLQDIADNYTSLADIAAANTTLLQLAQRSF